MDYEYKDGHYINVGKFIRNTEEARLWDKQIRKRDGKMCQECKTMFWDNRLQTYKGLEVHHIKTLSEMIKEFKISTKNYREVTSPLFDIRNGEVLCAKCHRLKHIKN